MTIALPDLRPPANSGFASEVTGNSIGEPVFEKRERRRPAGIPIGQRTIPRSRTRSSSGLRDHLEVLSLEI